MKSRFASKLAASIFSLEHGELERAVSVLLTHSELLVQGFATKKHHCKISSWLSWHHKVDEEVQHTAIEHLCVS